MLKEVHTNKVGRELNYKHIDTNHQDDPKGLISKTSNFRSSSLWEEKEHAEKERSNNV